MGRPSLLPVSTALDPGGEVVILPLLTVREVLDSGGEVVIAKCLQSLKFKWGGRNC